MVTKNTLPSTVTPANSCVKVTENHEFIWCWDGSDYWDHKVIEGHFDGVVRYMGRGIDGDERQESHPAWLGSGGSLSVRWWQWGWGCSAPRVWSSRQSRPREFVEVESYWIRLCSEKSKKGRLWGNGRQITTEHWLEELKIVMFREASTQDSVRQRWDFLLTNDFTDKMSVDLTRRALAGS